MSNIDFHRPHHEKSLPRGSSVALILLGTLATLSIIVAAVIDGQPLWLVLTLWLLFGPTITLAIAGIAVRTTSVHGSRAAQIMEAHESDG